MTTDEIHGSEGILQIKVALCDTKPEIWRRLVVSAEVTLARLHQVLQTAMGWESCHMHEFRVGLPREMRASTVRQPGSVGLSEALPSIGSSMMYVYDFGDYWEHVIVREECSEAEYPGYPVCVAGRLACPPEDCGGTGGYHDLLKTLKNPRSKRYAEMREWVGDDFDPDIFSMEAVNQQFKRSRTRRRLAT